MATFTVDFEDGSSHTYDNVPNDIDQQKVQDRASMEFADKKIVGITPSNISGEQPHETSIGTKAVGAAQTAFNIAKDIATSPLGVAAESIYGGKKFLLDPLLEALKQRGGVVGPSTPQIQIPQNVGGGPRPNIPAGNPAQTFEALGKNYGPATPPAGGPAAAEGSTFIQRMSQLARQYSPVTGMGGAPAAIGRSAIAAAPLGAAVALPGAAMMYHDYRNFQQQTPEQQRESAMSALSGTAPGQAGY